MCKWPTGSLLSLLPRFSRARQAQLWSRFPGPNSGIGQTNRQSRSPKLVDQQKKNEIQGPPTQIGFNPKKYGSSCQDHSPHFSAQSDGQKSHLDLLFSFLSFPPFSAGGLFPDSSRTWDMYSTLFFCVHLRPNCFCGVDLCSLEFFWVQVVVGPMCYIPPPHAPNSSLSFASHVLCIPPHIPAP